jgi:hypothetical protein
MGALWPQAWGKVVETFRSTQIDLKERAAAAKPAAWTKAVEKLRTKQAALAEEAAVASRLRLAEPVRAAATPPASPVSPVPNEAPARSERLGVRGGRIGFVGTEWVLENRTARLSRRP